MWEQMQVKVEALTLDRPDGLAMRAASLVREGIISGALTPGTHLSVPELARRLGVSRTPAREALLILEQEGLVGRRGTTGMQVLAGDTHTLVELLDMREVLEGLAARRAAALIDDDGRTALADIHAQHMDVLRDKNLDAHVRLDAEFHALIRRTAGSAMLDEQLERIERIAKVINRALSAEIGFDARMVALDHEGIFTAISGGEPEEAERAARGHVRRVARFFRSQRGQPRDAE